MTVAPSPVLCHWAYEFVRAVPDPAEVLDIPAGIADAVLREEDPMGVRCIMAAERAWARLTDHVGIKGL